MGIIRMTFRWPFRQIGLGLAICLVCSHFSSAAELQRFSETQPHMGVEFEVVLYAADEPTAKAAIAAAFERIAELDTRLSDYSLSSELSKLSAAAPTTEPVALSDDLFTVLHASQQLAAESAGAFDITIGPLTKLWRRARRQKELPDADLLKKAHALVGFQNLQLDAVKKTASLSRADMRLDLGGIAKGYAVDQALAVLVKKGFKQSLVRASGDIAAADPPPNEAGWKVGLAPLDPDDPPTVFVSLRQQAISTSGEARQHLVVNGRRYSHLIDPRTGQPLHGRMSITVIAPRGIHADSLASAVAVLGPEKGLKLLAGREGVSAFVLIADDDGQNVRHTATPNFRPLPPTGEPR
jgi:thiamine biosynthesis lipoprotein